MEYLIMRRLDQLVIGQLLNIEGELMEVIITDETKVKVGDTWNCTYASIPFKSKVLRKSSKQIYLYLPLFVERFPENKRKLPRIECEFPSYLYHVEGGSFLFKGSATLIDLTLKGFGFHSQDDFSESSCFSLHIQGSTLDIKPNIKIINKVKAEKGFRYGCKVLSYSNEDEFLLREYILSRQMYASKTLDQLEEKLHDIS